MARKTPAILSIGAAIASLSAMPVQNAEAKSVAIGDNGNSSATLDTGSSVKPAPTSLFQAGEDLLGFAMTKQADGTLVAQHSSHASHASHASSRY